MSVRVSGHPVAPWVVACVVVAVIALAVAFAPLSVALVVVGACAAAVLVRRYGAAHGVWYLILLTIPIKEPLSFDVHGTVSLYPVDVLLFALCGALLLRHGYKEVWRHSHTLRPLLAIVVLSVVGLYGASNVFWGVASIYRIAVQMAIFLTALLLVRDSADARRSLVFVALSLVAPVVYGFYQASLPFGAPVPDWGPHATAYDLFGVPFFRVFSTMNHPLNFSHYLTTGVGLCLGMAVRARSPRARGLLVLTAGAAAVCNLFTYSAGGLVGMLAAVIAVIIMSRSRRLMAAAVVVIVALALAAPPALTAKIDRLLSGRSITTAARLVTYHQSFLVLRDHPILGVGWGGIWGAFSGQYRLTRADAVAFGSENYFLHRAVATGALGLLFYVLVLVYYARNLRGMRALEEDDERLAQLRVGMAAAALAFFAQAQFIPAANISTNSVLWLFFALAEKLGGAGAVRSPVALPAELPGGPGEVAEGEET